MPGFSYFSPADYQNIYTSVDPVAVDDAFSNIIIPVALKPGDRVFFEIFFTATNTKLTDFYVNVNGLGVVNFNGYECTESYGATWSFMFQLIDPLTAIVYAVLNRSDTAPVILGSTPITILASDTNPYTFEIRIACTNGSLGTLYGFSLDKIS